MKFPRKFLICMLFAFSLRYVSGQFCVANPNANSTALTNGLNWACGPGNANCAAIQPGQPCYQQNNLTALASYAYNNYYQRTKASGGTCNFDNTAELTFTDPSYGSCIFTGSSGSGTNSSTGTTPTTSTNSSGTGTTTDGSGTTFAPIGPVDDGSPRTIHWPLTIFLVSLFLPILLNI